MTLRNLILLFLTPIFLAACFDMTRYKKYSITESFISYDSSVNSEGQEGKKFKYAYEEYNGDSNLIYQELYTNTEYFGGMWGKLKRKTNLFYNGKMKTKETIEFEMDIISREEMANKGSYTYTYEYKGKNLSKIFYDSKPVEEYQYDKNDNQIERKIINESNVPEYYRFTYRNGLKIRTQHFVSDTIIGTDTLIYDKNNRHIETVSSYEFGKMDDTVIERNSEGQMVEKKWREYYKSYSDYPFYNVNKYLYDDTGRLLKIEHYLDHKLKTVYQFQYD